MSKRLLLFCSSLLVVFVGSLAVDRLTGWFVSPPVQGLIFPRNVTRRFQTTEFSFKTTTNSFGFRDRDFSQNKKVKTRIIALGDSFTYGWGVAAEESWPKMLEQRLRTSGLDVEIANLGKPGASPRDYADIADRSIPLLHPDVVIVGVLQGDDLAQMDPSPPVSVLGLGNEPTKALGRQARLRRVAGWLYPNFLRIVDDQASASAAALTGEWQQQARLLTTAFTAEEKARLDKLDTQVKDAFRSGGLNPSLIYLSIHSPDYFLQTMDLNSAKTQDRLSRMSEQLIRIRKAASQINAKVIVVSVPYGIYVSQTSFASRRRLGFAVAPEMLTTYAEDEAVRNACRVAGVDFYDVTDRFREESVHEQFFFELDGHFNPAGHRYFAEALAPRIKSAIDPGTSK